MLLWQRRRIKQLGQPGSGKIIARKKEISWSLEVSLPESFRQVFFMVRPSRVATGFGS